MNWQTLIVVGILALIVYAWYTEKRRREAVEIEQAIDKKMADLVALDAKIAANKVDYDKALADLKLAPIPDDMFEHLGQPTPDPNAKLASQRPNLQADVRSGRLIDTNSGAVVDPRGPGEAATFNGA